MTYRKGQGERRTMRRCIGPTGSNDTGGQTVASDGSEAAYRCGGVFGFNSRSRFCCSFQCHIAIQASPGGTIQNFEYDLWSRLLRASA